MKTVDCYYCQSGDSTFYASENGWVLVKCASCGLLYVSPRVEDHEVLQAHCVGKHHGEKDLHINGTFDPATLSGYERVLRDLFDGTVPRDCANWLDVGCGHGEFLLAIRQFTGGRVALRGSEPNVHKQRSARQRGLRVDYIDPESHDERYDVISLLNVYSHLPNPPAFLGRLSRLLKPGGELILQTGDTAHFSSREHYRPFYLPDHLSFASEPIVVGILERLSFRIVCIRKYPLITADLKTVAVELVKGVRALIMPRYHFASKLRYLPRYRRYARTDMYIRARVD
jgi:SAM-dependent methyltransferase